jgi:hypothetical protein
MSTEMEDQTQERASDLRALAEAKFGKETPSDAEKLLLENVPKGKWAKCGPKHNDANPSDNPSDRPIKEDDDDPNNNPRNLDNWEPKRRIRAELVGWLCTDQEARKHVHWRGIQVYAADITGPLDLSFVNIPFPLKFRHCRLKKVINLRRAEVSELDLQDSLVQGISAHGLNVKHNVFLRQCAVFGAVGLRDAQIGGDLDCSGGAFTNPPQKDVARSGEALNADGINVEGDVFLSNGFAANGEVRLLGAQIGSGLHCDAGTFKNPPQKDATGSGKALSADGIDVKGSVFLRAGFTPSGEVRTSFTSSGEVRLVGAQIGGNLECDAGNFTNPPQKGVDGSGKALNADGIDVKGSVFLRAGFTPSGEVRTSFTASGEVRLLGAQIGGNLECDAGNFTNPPQKGVDGSGKALNADGINVKGNVFLTKRFTAKGEVRLPGAQIGGTLDCSDGAFANPSQKDLEESGRALSAYRIIVKSAVFFSDGFTADGAVDLEGAQIGGPFNCRNGNFQNATLELTDTLAAALYDSGLNDIGDGSAADYSPVVWPKSGNLLLDGFVYGRLSSRGRINVDKRLEWLGRQPSTPFRRQPYVQLAKVLKESGDSDDALHVLEKMEELRRSGEKPVGGRNPKWLARIINLARIRTASLWSFVLKRSIGYGYYPGRAIWLILLLSVLGWVVYGASYDAGTMVPTEKDAYKEFADPQTWRHVSPPYPTFSAPVYSLENSLPLVKLGQADKWRPGLGPGSSSPTSFLGRFATSPGSVLWFLRIQILLGWLLATLFVAGVSGIVHKE